MTLKCKRTCEWYYGLYITSVKCAISLDFVMNTFLLPLILLLLPHLILILVLHSRRGCSHTHQYPVRGLRICSRHWFHRLGQIKCWNIKLKQWEMRRVPFKHPNQMQSLSDFKNPLIPHSLRDLSPCKKKETTLVFAHQCFFLSQDVFIGKREQNWLSVCTLNSSTLCTEYERC